MHTFGIPLFLCSLHPLKHGMCSKCQSAQGGQILKCCTKPIGIFQNITKITISNSNVHIKPLSCFQLGKREIRKKAELHNQHRDS